MTCSPSGLRFPEGPVHWRGLSNDAGRPLVVLAFDSR